MKLKIVIFIVLGIFQPSIISTSFDTLYTQGLTAQQNMNWNEALDCYLQAYAVCPERIEPLVKIAQYYQEHEQLELAFMFARRACEQEVPEASYALEYPFYDFYRYQLLSDCASCVREWKLGLWATKKALQAQPKDVRLHERLCYYHEQLVIEAGRAIIASQEIL